MNLKTVIVLLSLTLVGEIWLREKKFNYKYQNKIEWKWNYVYGKMWYIVTFVKGLECLYITRDRESNSRNWGNGSRLLCNKIYRLIYHYDGSLWIPKSNWQTNLKRYNFNAILYLETVLWCNLLNQTDGVISEDRIKIFKLFKRLSVTGRACTVGAV